MHFIPFKNICYRTHLPHKAVVERLEEITGPEKVLRPIQVQYRRFSVKRPAAYRYLLRPAIGGTIQEDPEGTAIHISMRPGISGILLLLFWILVIGFDLFSFIKASIDENTFYPALLIPLLILLLAYILLMSEFNYESRMFQDDLAKAVEGEAI